jgi:hypothetical protein
VARAWNAQKEAVAELPTNWDAVIRTDATLTLA